MALKSKDLLSTRELSREDIQLILETASSFKEISTRSIKKVPTLRGRTVINLFFEPSTRTRTSFEIAEKRLSADSVNFGSAGSALSKGESLLDTARNLEAMAPDILVVRHGSSGVPAFLSAACRACVINAGDGTHEHPTQALLDALTILERKNTLSDLRVAIVGDLLHSRVFRSNYWLLKTMGSQVVVSGPPTLIPPSIEDLGVEVARTIEDAVEEADVVMMLRVQEERMKGNFFPSSREYFRLFGLTEKRLARARSDVIVMHPGPMNRGIEIDSTLADGRYSVILDQVTNGVAVRMAVLYLLTARSGSVTEPPAVTS